MSTAATNTTSPSFTYVTERLEEILLENLAIPPETAAAIFLAFSLWYGAMFAVVVGFIIKRTNWMQELDISLHHHHFKAQKPPSKSVRGKSFSSRSLTSNRFENPQRSGSANKRSKGILSQSTNSSANASELELKPTTSGVGRGGKKSVSFTDSQANPGTKTKYQESPFGIV